MSDKAWVRVHTREEIGEDLNAGSLTSLTSLIGVLRRHEELQGHD